jgi:hypothetical protein
VLEETWDKARNVLASSHTWLIVGYSLPAYDQMVVKLLRGASTHRPVIHVFDPNPLIASHISNLLKLPVTPHGGFPIAAKELQQCIAENAA